MKVKYDPEADAVFLRLAEGEIVDSGTIAGVGRADFVYARDPDGNIVELVAWNR